MNNLSLNPVHETRESRQSGPEEHDSAVSALSKFSDRAWNFGEEMTNPTYSKCSKIIRWDFKVGKRRCFTDPQFASLRLACKQFLYALLCEPERRRRYKPDTVTYRWRYLRPFVMFLLGRAYPIRRFKDVTRHVVDEYLKSLSLPNKKGKKRGKGALYNYYNTLKLLYLYRHKISDPIGFDPFGDESALTAVGLTSAEARRAKTEAIPDNIFSKLITSTLDYVNYYADFLIEAASAAERIRQELRGRDSSVINSHIIRQLSKIAAPSYDGGVTSFRVEVINAKTLAKHLLRLRTACFILIAALTGMRLSELLSLEEGCVEKESTDSGEFIWVHSNLHKTLDGSGVTPARWLCGPVAAKAVSVLERLTSEYRRKTGRRRLFVPVTKWGAHTTNGESVAATTMTLCLKDYVMWLDLRDEKGSLFNLHAHMFRRTFARHVVRSDTTNLLALKDHFKHLCLAMTDYYVGVDEELQDLLNDEANRLSFESFDKALRSDRLGGPRGKELVRQIDAAMADGRLPPEFRGEAGAHLRREMIVEWVEAGQQIYPGGAGNDCWFRAGSALCTKGDRPVVEVCNSVGCPNSIILPEHDPHWRRIEERTDELLRLNPSGEPYRQRLYMIAGIAKKVRRDIA